MLSELLLEMSLAQNTYVSQCVLDGTLRLQRIRSRHVHEQYTA